MLLVTITGWPDVWPPRSSDPVPKAPRSHRPSGQRHVGGLVHAFPGRRTESPGRFGDGGRCQLATEATEERLLAPQVPLHQRPRRNPPSSVQSFRLRRGAPTVRQRRPTASSNSYCRVSDTAAHGNTAIIDQPTEPDSAAEFKAVRPLRASAPVPTSKESSWVAQPSFGIWKARSRW